MFDMFGYETRPTSKPARIMAKTTRTLNQALATMTYGGVGALSGRI